MRAKLDLLLKKTYLNSGKGLENIPPEVSKPDIRSRVDTSKGLRGDVASDIEDIKKGQSEEIKAWAESLRKADEKYLEIIQYNVDYHIIGSIN